jgi:gamma-glutamyltranspeptidase/glutathione hydrolase
LALVLAACTVNQTPEGEPGFVRGFSGGIAADEPRAALIGRDVLSAGGSAADAAVATYFALAVTYPVAASLGGGGTCVVFDRARKRAEALTFLTQPPAAGGAVGAPGNVRGMGLLHGRYGRLRWERLLAPGEQVARLGHPVSRAYARALEEGGAALLEARGLGNLARGSRGRAHTEGEPLRQVELAAVLSRLRTTGAGDFISGELARAYVEETKAIGGRLTLADMRGDGIGWSEPLRARFENNVLFLAPTPRGAPAAAALWPAIAEGGGLFGGASVRRERLAEALGQAYAGLPADAPIGGIASTGFAAMDAQGQAVACSVTMGRPFGLQRLAGSTGIVAAPPPGGPGDETPFAVAMVAGNINVWQAFAAAAGSGGAPAAAALVEAAAEAMAAKAAARAALARPRLFRAGPAAALLHEPGLDPGLAQALAGQGVQLAEAARLGRVNLLHCADGLPRSPETCSFAADPRGFGLAFGSEQ